MYLEILSIFLFSELQLKKVLILVDDRKFVNNSFQFVILIIIVMLGIMLFFINYFFICIYILFDFYKIFNKNLEE